MPQEQRVRDLVAKMKLIPVEELIEGNKLLFCEDSIVRGTQLTSLQYQRLDDMIAAIGLPRERLCTYCWNGEELYGRSVTTV